MICIPAIELQTDPEPRCSVPAWFAEVVILANYLQQHGLLDALAQQVRLVRGRFGSYEPLDFLVLLLGYAISGERTLADFFARVAPFATAFMALFGRRCLPHRATLSRFLAAVDRPCLEAFRGLFQQHSFAQGWTTDTIGGLFDRQGRRYLVFDVDGTRQAARQRALSCDPALPAARRRLDAVCAPGYRGRKRGQVVRTRTTVLQMHTRQWVGTYGNKGNGQYREELAAGLAAITSYVQHFAFPLERALLRLDGQYGNVPALRQLIAAGVPFVTRGHSYQLLEHPQLQQVLAHPPTATLTSSTSGQRVELFEGGWLALAEGVPPVRVLVTRHPAPTAGKEVKVGKRIGDWVYELFLTVLEAEGFLGEDVLDLYHGRGAFESVLAAEDVEEDPDRWCSYSECGQELWQIACQWVWNLRLCLGKTMQGAELREIEWAPATAAPAVLEPEEDVPLAYSSWQLTPGGEETCGRFGTEAFSLQENGRLRCPAGNSLWLGDLCQEDAATQRAVYRAYQTDCQCCHLRHQCLMSGAKADRARRVSAVRYRLPPPAKLVRPPVLLGPIRWVDVAGRALRRSWTAHWRTQYVEVLPLVHAQPQAKPPPRPPRAMRAHQRWSWQERLARNAWWGPAHFRVTVAGVPACLAST